MDLTAKNYSESDFKEAAAALLPPGEYWQYKNGSDLDKLLSALGREFKTTHDETTLNALYDEDNNQIGWRIADYQSLLNLFSVRGEVFDKPCNPNFIYIECDASENVGSLMRRMESHRLPHTAFHWETRDRATLSCAAHSAGVQIERSHSVLAVAAERVPVDIYCVPARSSTIVSRETKVLRSASHKALVNCIAARHCIIINRRTLRAI